MSEQTATEPRFVQWQETQSHVILGALIVEPREVMVRCVRLATGQVVYEFAQPGVERITRYDADAHDRAIDQAREGMLAEKREETES